MPEIKHDIATTYLNSLQSEKIPPLFFIWGEDFLCKKVFETVISFLLPGNLKDFGYELLEGEEAVVPVIMERLCTYSFFQERRVVAIKNAPLFTAATSSSIHGFNKHNLENLMQLIEKGFPENHYLVITSSTADKRRALFNTIKSRGIAFDCTVPQGSTKADKDEQAGLLHLAMKDILDRTGKGIDGDAFQSLTDMTGFDPVALNDNLERLTSFIGTRDRITLKDVQAVVKRTKKDAVFELTNAVAQKNLDSALFYYKSLCDSGFHPLQLLASIVNQMRKVLVVKAFVVDQAQRGNTCWRKGGQSYQQFTGNTIPFVTNADLNLQDLLRQWNEETEKSHADRASNLDEISEPDSNNGTSDSKNGKGKKRISADKKSVPAKKGTADKKITTDLAIASGSKSMYPVYQTFLKSDNFRLDELASIMMELSDLDYRFKSSSDEYPAIVLEEMIIRICTGSIHK
ncbi:MAG: DNA polymerase III subunit delta [Desulfamplus sp.]|nr:DNA polymerase III subunit delta [Desulfamplus sp.]